MSTSACSTSVPTILVILMAMVTFTGCATPRDAARLADLTSAQVNAVNAQMRDFVAQANESRINDAQRIAATRLYFQTVENTALLEVQAWKDNPNDPSSKAKVAAFDSLQQDASKDMATVDTGATQFTNLEAALQSGYGQLTYSPSELNSVISNLETISKRATNSGQLSALRSFSQSVISTAKSALSAAQLNSNGVSKNTTAAASQ